MKAQNKHKVKEKGNGTFELVTILIMYILLIVFNIASVAESLIICILALIYWELQEVHK